ncbi:hypothetical protein QZH41_002812, partial [Actinostola sp. cb2023]
MDDHSDQSEITSSEEEHSDDSSPENFTDDSQESESSESNYGSSDSDDNQSLPQCWTTLIDEAMGRHEVKVESLMEEYEHQALQSVLDIINNEREKSSLKAALAESMVEYDVSDCTLAGYFELGDVQSNLHIPRYVIERYRRGGFPAKYIGVISSGRHILIFQVEATNEISANNCSKRLRQIIYSVLESTTVLEWDRDGRGVKMQCVKSIGSISGYGGLPNLESLQERDEEQRRRLLLTILEVDPAAFQALPDTEQLFAASMRYWISHANPRVTKRCAKSLILQHLKICDHEPQQEEPLQSRFRLVFRFDVVCQHNFAQWQAVMAETLFLNNIFLDAFPAPDISTLYDGVVAQMIMHGLSKEMPLDYFVRTPHLDRYFQLYSAVTDGLANCWLHSPQSDTHAYMITYRIEARSSYTYMITYRIEARSSYTYMITYTIEVRSSYTYMITYTIEARSSYTYMITYTIEARSSYCDEGIRLETETASKGVFLLCLLGQKDGLDVGKYTTLSDGNSTKKFVQLLVVPDGQLQVTGDDSGLLNCCLGQRCQPQLEDFSTQRYAHFVGKRRTRHTFRAINQWPSSVLIGN